MIHLLIVDDHPDIRNLLADRLTKLGYSVSTAANGMEAILVTSQTLPSLILMDVNMPELDGLEATMRIRANAESSAIPVIALTAYSLPEDQQRAIAAGCDGFLTKPINFDELIQTIERLLG